MKLVFFPIQKHSITMASQPTLPLTYHPPRKNPEDLMIRAYENHGFPFKEAFLGGVEAPSCE